MIKYRIKKLEDKKGLKYTSFTVEAGKDYFTIHGIKDIPVRFYITEMQGWFDSLQKYRNCQVLWISDFSFPMIETGRISVIQIDTDDAKL